MAVYRGLKAGHQIHRWVGAGLLCLLLSLLLPVMPVRASGVTVAIEKATERTSAAELVVLVSVSEVQGFDAAQFDLHYDPEFLQAAGVASGEIGGTAVAVDGWGLMPPGQPGTIRVIANVPGASGLSGSGYLAEVRFTVSAADCATTAIVLTNGLLGDKQGSEIPADWIGSSLEVCGGPQAGASPRPADPGPAPGDIASQPVSLIPAADSAPDGERLDSSMPEQPATRDAAAVQPREAGEDRSPAQGAAQSGEEQATAGHKGGSWAADQVPAVSALAAQVPAEASLSTGAIMPGRGSWVVKG